MKSYLSLIPISARVRRRQNRMTVFCVVIALAKRICDTPITATINEL